MAQVSRLFLAGLAVSYASAVCAGAAWAGSVAITGAGSTFAQPLYEKWAELAAGPTGVKLNYQAVGSGAGQKLVINRTVDFGASDAPVPAAKLQAAKLAQFPTAMGAISIVVHVPGVAGNKLHLTGPVLAQIYSGKITQWDAPEIALLNPDLKLPDSPIAPIYRADGSGTTFVFTTYLSKVSKDFADTVGAATAVQWPAGTGAKGNAGIGAAVRNTVGAIGYVEAAFATLNKLPTAKLQNKDGKFVAPTQAGFAAAAANADWAGAKNFAVDLTDQPGATTWPIVSATFVLLPKDGDAAKRAAVISLFDWAFTHGDDAARGLEYVTLPAAVKDSVRASWKAGQ